MEIKKSRREQTETVCGEHRRGKEQVDRATWDTAAISHCCEREREKDRERERAERESG